MADEIGQRIQDRRQFIRYLSAGATGAAVATAGCLGGTDDPEEEEDEDDDTLVIPAMDDLTGAISSLWEPTAQAEQDLVNYVREEGLFFDDLEFERESYEFGYETDRGVRIYQELTEDDDHPPVIRGLSTELTTALAPRVERDEIIWLISQTPNRLIGGSPYMFSPAVGYGDQGRLLVEYIAEHDPEATVAFYGNDANYGRSVLWAADYAEELGLEVHDDYIVVPLAADTADEQMLRLRDAEVDWAVGSVIEPTNMVFMDSQKEIYPELNVAHNTFGTSEIFLEQNPEPYEGLVFVSSYKVFDHLMEEDSRATQAVHDMFDRYHDMSVDEASADLANRYYTLAISVWTTLFRALELTKEMGGDVNSGPDLREGFNQMEEFDRWGVGPPLTFSEEDPRPTMTGIMYEVRDGNIEHLEDRTLPRRDEWLVTDYETDPPTL